MTTNITTNTTNDSEYPNVLIINDDPNQRKRISQIIEGLCNVVAPESHQAMVEQLQAIVHDRSSFALVIVDFAFDLWNPDQPPLDGREVVTKWLRPSKGIEAAEQKPLVMFMTNYPDGAMFEQLERDYGVYVAKFGDFTPDSIYQAVEAIVGQE